jgi:hypothetical protein
VRNWYSQAIGNDGGVLQCDLECSKGPINKTSNILPVPVLNLIAGNEKITCDDRKLTGADCDTFLVNQNVMIRAGKEQTSLGTAGSEAQQCEGICNHDFAWLKVDFIYSRVIPFLKKIDSM